MIISIPPANLGGAFGPAFWLAAVQVLSTFGIGLLAWRVSKRQQIIAEEQRKIAADKVELDLFDRRYEAYVQITSAADERFREIMTTDYDRPSGEWPFEAKTRFRETSRVISLLFGSAADDLISTLDAAFSSLVTAFVATSPTNLISPATSDNILERTASRGLVMVEAGNARDRLDAELRSRMRIFRIATSGVDHSR